MKQRKTLTLLYYAKITLLFLSTAVALSCRKDDDSTSGNIKEKARAWYLQSHASDLSNLKSATGVMTKITQEPVWDDAKTVTDNGAQVVSVPVKTTMNEKLFDKGGFLLLIVKNGETFDSRVIFSDDLGKFQDSKLTPDIIRELKKTAFGPTGNKHFYNMSKQGTPLSNSSFQASISPVKDLGVMNLKEAGCTDWYLVTSYFDENGFFLYSEEQYLYSTGCTAEGGGGGGGGAPEPVTVDFGHPVSENVTANIGEGEYEENGAYYRTKYYSWVFHKAYNEGWVAKSYEKTKQKLVGTSPSKWDFVQVEHLNESLTGANGSGATIIKNWVNVTFDADVANVKLNYKIQRGTNIGGYAATVTGSDQNSIPCPLEWDLDD